LADIHVKIDRITFKAVPAQKILSVDYNGQGHIAPYFGKLALLRNFD